VINSRITFTMDKSKNTNQLLDTTNKRHCEYTADDIKIKGKERIDSYTMHKHRGNNSQEKQSINSITKEILTYLLNDYKGKIILSDILMQLNQNETKSKELYNVCTESELNNAYCENQECLYKNGVLC
jgi:hypothetical protein